MVLLPQPDGPIIAVIWFSRNVQGDAAHGPEAAVEDADVVEPEHRLRSCVCVLTRLHLGRDAWTVTASRWVFAIVLRHLGPSSRHVITEFTDRMPDRGAMAGLDRASPSALVKAVVQPDRDRVHRQQDDQQDHDGRRSQHPELLLESRIQLRIWTGRAVNWLVSPSGLKVTKVSAPSRSSCPAQRGPRILETRYCPLVATCSRRAGHQLPTAVGESPAPTPSPPQPDESGFHPNCTDGMRFPTEPRSSLSNRPAPGHRLVERGSAGQALVASMGSRPEPYSTGRVG